MQSAKVYERNLGLIIDYDARPYANHASEIAVIGQYTIINILCKYT